MPSSPIDPKTHAEIYRLGQQNPRLSNRVIAKMVGKNDTTVMKYRDRKPEDKTYPKKHPEQVVTEKSEVVGDTWNISMPKTRIRTLDELVEHCKIDLSVWEVERFIANKWEMGYKDALDEAHSIPLFQVKAYLRKRKNIIAIKQEIEALKEYAKKFAKTPFKIKRSPKITGVMLEIHMPDIHFGKQAWDVETGWGDYDLKIAERVFREAFDTLISRVSHYKFDEIVFTVGNDLLQSDNPENQTYKGTPVSCDSRYYKVFRLVCNLMIEAIEKLRTLARKVKVVVVRGNHDTLSSWHLGESLDIYFSRYGDVLVDNQPRPRKYHCFGKNMIMFTHGHEGKIADYPMLMAIEEPEMWAATEFRECHTGHRHTKQDSKVPQISEHKGVRVRIFDSLGAADDWHVDNGHVGNQRSAEALVWHETEGQIASAVYTLTKQ